MTVGMRAYINLPSGRERWRIYEEGAVPSDEEIQAVIDVLFNMGSLRYAYELRMLDEAYKFSSVPRIAIHFGRLPKRLSTGWSKRQFDEDFREPVRIALEQAARIRKERKKAIDIYPVNANAVSLGAGKWAVELYMGAAGTDLVEGFNSPYEADGWIRQKAQAYMEQKGVPKGTKILKVGERY